MPEEAHITVRQLLVPMGAIGTIVIATWQGLAWFDSRYVTRSDLEAAEAASAALQMEIDELREEVSRGDRIAQKAAEVFTATKFWADIMGREAMYRAQVEAGTITESGRARWETMRGMLNNATAELGTLTTELDALRNQ